MKRIFDYLLIAIICLVLSACGKKELPVEPSQSEQPAKEIKQPKAPAPVSKKTVSKKGIQLRLNLPVDYTCLVKTKQLTETITQNQSEILKSKETSQREYLIECLRITDEGEMVTKKTFTTVKMNIQRSTGGEYETFVNYDSTDFDASIGPIEYYGGIAGQSVSLRYNSLGQAVGQVGGGRELANRMILFMNVNTEEALRARDNLVEGFKQTPVFFLEYPEQKLKPGDTWTAPYAFTKGSAMEGALWNWKLESIRGNTAVIHVWSEGQVKESPDKADSVIKSDIHQQSDVQLEVDIQTGVILSATIKSTLSGTLTLADQNGDNQDTTLTSKTTATIETLIQP